MQACTLLTDDYSSCNPHRRHLHIRYATAFRLKASSVLAIEHLFAMLWCHNNNNNNTLRLHSVYANTKTSWRSMSTLASHINLIQSHYCTSTPGPRQTMAGIPYNAIRENTSTKRSRAITLSHSRSFQKSRKCAKLLTQSVPQWWLCLKSAMFCTDIQAKVCGHLSN